jgi:hypothetical protein
MKTIKLYEEWKLLEKKKRAEWHDSDAPDANGKFRDLNPKKLASWLIKTRKKDLKKITGSLNQQINFNQDNKKYQDKMEKTRKEVYKQLGRDDLLNESQETYDDYPKAAVENAKKAIRWRDEYGRDVVKGGTRVGWARANQLANKEPLSRDVVSRMAQFNRHRKNSEIADKFKGEPWRDSGYLSFLLWGGKPGIDWAIRKMKQIRKAENVSEDFQGYDIRKTYQWYHGSTNKGFFGKNGIHIGSKLAATQALESRIGVPAEVEIIGPMSNSQSSPHEDFKANGYMKRALNRGNAKNGYYYVNVAEDSGSISAVVPNGEWLKIKD